MSNSFRLPVELQQVYKKKKTFTYTTSGATAETALTVSNFMEEGNKISIMIEDPAGGASGAGAYIEFDDTADSSAMLIPQDEGYFDDGISITSVISILRFNSTDVRIRGIVWGR
jgi:hypothetical protein